METLVVVALADYPSTGALDFEPSIDEFRIVGDLKADPLGITSIRSGDGVIPTQVITVDTNKPHGLFKDTPVLVAGISTNVDVYNGSFVVTKVNSLTSFEANLGVSTLAPTATGTIFALPSGFTSNDGNVSIEDENLSGRMVPTYAGITTTLSSSVANCFCGSSIHSRYW